MQPSPVHFALGTNWSLGGVICAAMLILGCSAEVNYTPAEGSSEIAITHFSFGEIVVAGKTFEDDVVIFADGSVRTLATRLNHVIQLRDIEDLISGPVKMIIVGTGTAKKCSVTDEIKQYAASRKIEVHILDTFEAVKLFNASDKAGLAACFHVTC